MMLTKVHRHALGSLAALAVTVGMVAAPMAGTANADSLSLNAGTVKRVTAQADCLGGKCGEEIPSLDVSVAGGNGHNSPFAGKDSGSME